MANEGQHSLVTEWDGEIDVSAGAGFVMQLRLSPEETQRAIEDVRTYLESLATHGRDQVPRKYWIIRARNRA